MQDLFSCVLQPDSHTVACRVTNDGNLFGGWQNESAGGQTAVLGRGRKCCEGHKTVTLVALRLGCERGHFVGQEHILEWRAVLKYPLHFLLSSLFIFWCFNCVPALPLHCWVPARGDCIFPNSPGWFGPGSADFAMLGPEARQLEVGSFHCVLLKGFFVFSWPLDVICAVLALWMRHHLFWIQILSNWVQGDLQRIASPTLF